MDLVTPISHLFKDKNAELIMENTDFEAREKLQNIFLNHYDFDLNIGLTEKQIQFLVDFVKPREDKYTFQAARDCKR